MRLDLKNLCALLSLSAFLACEAADDSADSDTQDSAQMSRDDDAALPDGEVECEPGPCEVGQLCVRPAPVCENPDRGFDYPPDVCAPVPGRCQEQTGGDLVECLVSELCELGPNESTEYSGLDDGQLFCMGEVTDCF